MPALPSPPPHGIYIDRYIITPFVISWPDLVTFYAQIFSENLVPYVTLLIAPGNFAEKHF